MHRSSLPVALAAFLLTACETGTRPGGASADAGANTGAGPSGDGGSTGPEGLDKPVPPLATVVEFGCADSFVTPGYNDCDGEDLLALDLISAEDADGDGIWEAGETLRLQMELFSTFEVDADADPWEGVHYPGVLLQLPEGLSAPDSPSGDPTLEGRVAVSWWYLIYADDSYPFTVDLVAAADVTASTELLFTVASLMCSESRSDAWHRCPTPSPLRVRVGG